MDMSEDRFIVNAILLVSVCCFGALVVGNLLNALVLVGGNVFGLFSTGVIVLFALIYIINEPPRDSLTRDSVEPGRPGKKSQWTEERPTGETRQADTESERRRERRERSDTEERKRREHMHPGYLVLGLHPGASQDDIVAAYRKLAC